jgi:hypothetical protein
LDKFKDNLLALNHSDRLSNSLSALVYKVSRDLSDKNALVSSAKIMK